MAKTIGIGFSIGAKVSPTVASAFSTIEQKVKASAGALASLEKKTKVLTAANTLRGDVGRLQAQYAAGGGQDIAIKAKLDATIAAYKKAKLAADEYGVSVADYATEISKANKQLSTHEQRLKALSSAKSHQDAAANYRGRAMESTIPAAAMVLPIGAAISFESAMADVAKTMDGMRTKAGELTPAFYAMQNSVLRLGRDIPLAHKELATLYAIAGQQGMTNHKEIEEYAIMAAHMAVSFGMANKEAADAIGSYKTQLNLTTPEVRSLLDLMNQYANTTTATEQGIAQIVQRIGTLGKIGGIAAKPVAALAATLDAMKVSPEIASTGIKNLILAMTAGSAATKTQQEAFAKLKIDTVELAEAMQKDGPATIIDVLEAVKELPKAEQLSIMQQIFGKESLAAIAPLLDRLDLVKQNLITAGDASAYAGAMQAEFNNRSKTTANALELTRNKLTEVSTTLSSTVLPAIVGITTALSPVIIGVAEFANNHQTLTATLVGTTAAFVVLKPLVFGMMATYHGVAGAMAIFRASQTATTIGTKALTVAQQGLNLAMRANPIGIVITAVASLAAWFTYCYNKVGTFKGAILEMWQDVVGATKAVTNFFSFGDDDEEQEETAKKNKAQTAHKGSAAGPMMAKSHGPNNDYKNQNSMDEKQGTALAPVMARSHEPMGTSAVTVEIVSPDDKIPPMPEDMPKTPDYPPMPVGGGATMNFSMPITINGVADGELAQGIFNALERNKSRLEDLVQDIINDQVRVAYGN